METTIIMLREKLELQLKSVNGDDAVKGYDQCQLIVLGILRELRAYISDHPVEDTEAEIHYFKHTLPLFYSQFIYYTLLYNAEVCKISLDKEKFHIYLENEKSRIDTYLLQHQPLQLYYHSGKTNQDIVLFTSGNCSPKIENIVFLIDEQSCEASWEVGMLLAYEKYRSFINNVLHVPNPFEASRIELKISKAEATEFIMTIYEAQCFHIGKGPASITELVDELQKYFPYDLKDIYSVDLRNRMRKKDPHPFISKLLTCYQNRINRLE